MLGVYLGDGCVTHQNGREGKTWPVFRLNTIDMDFAEETKQALQALSDRKVSIHTHPVRGSHKPNHSVRCGDGALCEILKTDTANKTAIPCYVEEWGSQLKLDFIRGIMDSEGFVAANSNPTNRRYYMGYKSCDVWVPEFVRILESVGIKLGKVSAEEPRKAGYKTPVRFAIKMQSWIDSGARFSIKRKQDRVAAWASHDAYTMRKCPRRSTSETNTPEAERPR